MRSKIPWLFERCISKVSSRKRCDKHCKALERKDDGNSLLFKSSLLAAMALERVDQVGRSMPMQRPLQTRDLEEEEQKTASGWYDTQDALLYRG